MQARVSGSVRRGARYSDLSRCSTALCACRAEGIAYVHGCTVMPGASTNCAGTKAENQPFVRSTLDCRVIAGLDGVAPPRPGPPRHRAANPTCDRTLPHPHVNNPRRSLRAAPCPERPTRASPRTDRRADVRSTGAVLHHSQHGLQRSAQPPCAPPATARAIAIGQERARRTDET